MTLEIQDDHSVYDTITKELQALDNLSIEIGVFGEDDSTMAMIATVHEFGCNIKMTDKMRRYLGAMGLFKNDGNGSHPKGDGYIHIPERSFIRSTFDEKIEEWAAFFETRIEKLCNLELTAQQAYSQLGALIVGDIQTRMKSLEPPLTKFTLEHRPNGGASPLIDTGALRQHITWKVVDANADV